MAQIVHQNFNRPNRNMKFKLNIIILGFLTVGFLVLAIRIVFISFFAEFNGVKYGTKAYNQQLSSLTVKANRGTIYDMNMIPLAQSITVWTVSISPNQIKDGQKELISSKLSEILEVDYEKIIKKCESKTKYEIIKKKVEKAQRDQILDFMKKDEIDCITMTEDSKRCYPLKNLAAHTIGFTGGDNQGLLGIELFYDKELRGVDGKTVSVQNGRGGPMPYEFEDYYPPTDGNSLVLSLDSNIQRYCDSVLEEHLKFRKPLNRALAIVMNIYTGEIVAMSVKPDFDLNKPFEVPSTELFPAVAKFKEEKEAREANWKNKAVSEIYEPGSVFKVVTGSAALEENVVSVNSMFTCGGGIKVGDRIMHCWKTDGSHGTQNLAQAYANSCNPAFIKIGQALGAERFFKYFKLFGLTAKTGIDLPAEASSKYYDEKGLTAVSLASESMGQTISVTPIQMITAFCAATNGGNLVTPHVAKQVIDKNGNVIKTNPKTIKRQVISQQTSDTLRELLEGVVNGIDNKGTNASVPGYRMGGKTGTAQKLKEFKETGVMRYVSSIIGLITADEPKYALMCLLDSPTTYGQYYGGQTASPIFAQIAQQIAPYLNIKPKYSPEELEEFSSTVPSCEGLSIEEAKEKLKQTGFTAFEVIGENDEVVKQIPEVGSKVNKTAKIILYTDQDIKKNVVVPDVTGLNQVQANKALADSGLNISMENITKKYDKLKVFHQSPEAGISVPKGTIVSLTFLVNNNNIEGTY